LISLGLRAFSIFFQFCSSRRNSPIFAYFHLPLRPFLWQDLWHFLWRNLWQDLWQAHLHRKCTIFYVLKGTRNGCPLRLYLKGFHGVGFVFLLEMDIGLYRKADTGMTQLL